MFSIYAGPPIRHAGTTNAPPFHYAATTCFATVLETRRPLPADAMIPDPIFNSTHAMTIDAPPEQVWPWIAQLASGHGERKMSYLYGSFLEPARIPSAIAWADRCVIPIGGSRQEGPPHQLSIRWSWIESYRDCRRPVSCESGYRGLLTVAR